LFIFSNDSYAIVRHVNLGQLRLTWQPVKGYSLRWSILICSLPRRHQSLCALVNKLVDQIQQKKLEQKIEIVLFIDSGQFSVGFKRQVLIQQSHGEYVSSVDDDDDVSESYIEKLYHATEFMPDVVSLKGIRMQAGIAQGLFVQSISFMKPFAAHGEWWNNTTITMPFDDDFFSNKVASRVDRKPMPIVCRYASHLNVIRRDIMLQVPFNDTTIGEDLDQAIRLYKSGRLIKEASVNDIVYIYNFDGNQ